MENYIVPNTALRNHLAKQRRETPLATLAFLSERPTSGRGS
jgi:hypothetical protein